MKYRIDFSNGQYSKFIVGAENVKQLLQNLADGTAVSDVRIIYKSGVSDSVMDIYKKYIPQTSEGRHNIKVFYTFGTDPRFPFCGGWIEIEAPNMKEAHAIFREHYPDRIPGTLNCSDYYTEDQFNESGMAAAGNRGAFCHRRIRDLRA